MKQIALRASLLLVLALSAITPAYSQSDTTATPTKLGFFAGPVISKGPLHAILGATFANDGPIAISSYIDPGDTTLAVTTTSAIKLWTWNGWTIHALIGGELLRVTRPLTLAEQTTYLKLATGAAIQRHLFDGCSLIIASTLNTPTRSQRQLRILAALHFEIGAETHRVAP